MASKEELRLLGADIVAQIQAEAGKLGKELNADLESVALYAGERADHLSLAIGEPGFQAGLRAERDNVLLRAALTAVSRADQIDARILAVAQGSIALAARGIRLLAGAPPVA